jgi:hypothetical protein
MMIMAMISMITSFFAPLLLRRLHKHSLLALAHGRLGLALLLIPASHLESSWGLWLLLAGFAFTCIGFSASFGIAMGEALASCRHQIASPAVLCLAQITVSAGYIWLMGWRLALHPARCCLCPARRRVTLSALSRPGTGLRQPRPWCPGHGESLSMRPLIDLDLNLLVVFRLLLQERSVTKAAKKLNVTAPTVSKALARLRDWFDDPLFLRTQRG